MSLRLKLNLLIALDQLLWVLLTLGKAYPAESFSSAAYRAETMGKFYGKARPMIDWLFSWLGQTEHCKKAYFSAKHNLPEDMR